MTVTRVCTFLTSLMLLSTSNAQGPAFPAPDPEHAWLQRFEGKWTTESKGTIGPGQPEMHCNGTVSCRMLGKFWVINEWNGDMAGVPVAGVQTIGFDSKTKKYVGTWVDGMTNHLWNYEGLVENDTKMILEAKGPNLITGEETGFRDTYEFKSADEMHITSEMLGDDGQWMTFMSGTAKRAGK